MKVCSECEQEKEYADFYLKGGRAGMSGITSQCKVCIRKKRATYVEKNPDKRREQDLLMSFGITLAQYNKMFAQQEGCCAICNRHQTEFKRNLAVDHDHKSGFVRGLLCGACNTAIGKLQEDVKLFNRAIEYLKAERKNCLKVAGRRGRRSGFKPALQGTLHLVEQKG